MHTQPHRIVAVLSTVVVGLLAGCAGTESTRPATAAAPARVTPAVQAGAMRPVMREGQTERAVIQLFPCGVKTPEDRARCVRDGADTMTVEVSPLTGKVTVKDGAVDLPKAPGSDEEASERQDTGSSP